ncbi:MAG TPA: SGNH/GDSL hydrolase family protein [Pseudolysinimonas sp.]|nr:SGNH/GDSL hydrolase family protein [Pseudolysinimonas sp.]
MSTGRLPERKPGLLRASRALAVLQGPVVLRQGRRLRQATPHLPDAALPWTGEVPGPDPVRLLVLGDSTAAGVGAPTQEDALPGWLARALQERTGRGIRWRAVGENGATARDLVERYLEAALEQPADLLFLTIGANDAMKMRGAGAYVRDVRAILDAFAGANPGSFVVMSSLPVFGRFTLLPDPLRTALYRHSLALEGAARRLLEPRPLSVMSADPPPYADDFWADDLFHPGPNGYRDWAEWAIDEAWDRGLAAALQR